VDVLEWCEAEAPDFFEALRYEIVEGLEVLQFRQRERLREFEGKLGWSSSLEELPRFTGVHFSNELIDAFPVHLVRFVNGEWRERYVTPEPTWVDQSIHNADLIERLADVPRIEGYTTEVSLDAPRWATALAAKIERGWVLAIDYGYGRDRYYSPQRTEGTLFCYSRHARSPDPLANPGSCDITAHVEFTSLVRAFRTAGMQMAGFTDQHHFLTGLVGSVFADRAPSPQEARGLKTLLHPEMLGTTFQVLGLARAAPPAALAGFRFAAPSGDSGWLP